MQDREALDRYFTEQVVGESMVIEMGPSANVRREPARGLKLHLLEAKAELVGQALQGDAANLGKPVSSTALSRTRRQILIGGLLLILVVWSAALWWIFLRFAR